MTVADRTSDASTSLATRGGQRLVTYLRMDEVKPPSRLPLALSAPARRHPGTKPRRSQ